MSLLLNAANNAVTSLAANITAGATSIPVTSVAGFPVVPFVVTIGAEIIRVDTVNAGTNTFSVVVRAQENTTASAHNAGTSVEHRFTAGMYYSHHNLTTAHGATMSPMPGTIPVRDALGRFQVTDGLAAAEVATVAQVMRNRYARHFLTMGG